MILRQTRDMMIAAPLQSSSTIVRKAIFGPCFEWPAWAGIKRAA